MKGKTKPKEKPFFSEVIESSNIYHSNQFVSQIYSLKQ